MINRRHFLGTATLGGVALASLPAVQALAQTSNQSAPPAGTVMIKQLNEPGPEARFLAKRVGIWDVTETVWPAPHAAPIMSTGLVAERVMIGSLLQEFIRPPNDTARSAVKRTALLCYNRLDGRWDYVSFDARDPVGLMPAWSLGRGELDRILFNFAPLAVVGGDVATWRRVSFCGCGRKSPRKGRITIGTSSISRWRTVPLRSGLITATTMSAAPDRSGYRARWHRHPSR